MTRQARTLIESLGVYLPEKSVSTADIVRDCVRPLRIPLGWVTGIKSRRMAGDNEFAIDLAARAVENCLARSRHDPEDIDLLICANIARCDGVDQTYHFEPSTSARLRHQFGFHRALAFDVTNACAGMFTAVYLVDALIRSGAIRRAMVVSGEYITPLTDTAQLDIESAADPRLACLTVGDAGAAVILERTDDGRAGFEALELYTLGRYSSYCVAGPSDRAHGGVTMVTDMKRLADVCARHGRLHAERVARNAGLHLDDVDWVIPHQTSRHTLDTLRLPSRVVNNLAHRGNTASTTHFLALADQIAEGRIHSGERLVFSISASGATIGTAVYHLDDLPDRLRGAADPTPKRRSGPGLAMDRPAPPVVWQSRGPGVCIESVATVSRSEDRALDTVGLLRTAAQRCLAASRYRSEEMDLLIFAGVYRSGFVMEPAIAAILAGELRMNDDIASFDSGRTLAFDVFNGAMGLLNACQVATEAIREGGVARVMICAAEVEANLDGGLHPPYGLHEGASAIILHASKDGRGFGTSVTKYFTQHLSACRSYCSTKYGPPIRMVYQQDPRLESLYVECILDTLSDLLQAEGGEMSRYKWILPPQISAAFIDRLRHALGEYGDRVVDAERGGDWFTSSVPVAFEALQRSGRAARGDLGLIIAAGSGIQVGCTTYRF